MSSLTTNIYDEIGRPSVKHYKYICKLVEPLNSFFGIDRFWRNFHRNDGTYSVLGNCPPVAELFFGQNLYKGHPYFRSPTFFQSGYVLPELFKCNDFESTQGRLRGEGNCHHVLIHIRKQKNGFVEYGFATSKLSPGFETVYMNHLSSINKFVDFFENAGAKLIQEADERRINISEVIGPQYYEKPTLANHILVPEDELRFLGALAKNLGNKEGLLSLTKSERVCLRHYLSGYTMQNIAKMLCRSPRTIEAHLENAKAKLGVNSRSALFEMLGAFCDFL